MFPVRPSTFPPVSVPTLSPHQSSFDNSLSQSQTALAGSSIVQMPNVQGAGNPFMHPDKRAFLSAYAKLSKDISGYIFLPKEIPSPMQFEEYKRNNTLFKKHVRNYLNVLVNQIKDNIEYNKNLLDNLQNLSLPEGRRKNLKQEHQENIKESENLYNKLIASLNDNGSNQLLYNNFILQFAGNSPHNSSAITRMEKLVIDNLNTLHIEKCILDLIKKTDDISAIEAPYSNNTQNNDDFLSSPQHDVERSYSEFLLPDSEAAINALFS